MSILSVDTISPIGSGTTITLNAAKIVVGTGITFESNGQATYAGIITATSFSGSGANLTGLAGGGTGLDLNDNTKIRLGTGNDYEIYHDGSNAVHRVTGDGDLKLLVEEKNFIVQGTGGHQILKGIDNGAVDLYHNNTKRLATTGNGADVFGNGTSNNYFKLVNSSATGNASHHMTLDTYGAGSGGSYWSDLKIDASNIQLNTYTGNRATLSNNALTFATGVNIAMANGNGINFAATSDASGMQNELLDDYEEGVWTPLVRNSSGTGTAGAANYGYYTKIGNVVHAHATVHWTALNSGTTSSSALIVGLPFSTKNATGYRCQHLTGAQIVGVQAGSTNNISIAVDGNMSTAYIINVNNAAGASSNYIHTPTINSSGTIYGLSITYLT